MKVGRAARGRLAALLLLGILLIWTIPRVAPADDSERDPPKPPALLEVAERAQRYTTFLDALRRTGADELLEGQGPFTVFAPTDAAFIAMPDHKREVLFSPDHRAELKKLLRYHIVPGRIPPDEAEFAERAQAMTQQLKIEPISGDKGRSGEKRRLRINEAETVGDASPASNGQFYGIDKVLIPHFHNLFLPGPPPP